MAKKENETAAQGQQSEKLKALKAAMEKIEKDFGKGSIMKLGEERIDNIQVIPTGSIALDYALGVGGYPRGRIVEIYGPESSGKTTLAIHAIAEAQKILVEYKDSIDKKEYKALNNAVLCAQSAIDGTTLAFPITSSLKAPYAQSYVGYVAPEATSSAKRRATTADASAQKTAVMAKALKTLARAKSNFKITPVSTGIEGIHASQAVKANANGVYNLAGQKVAETTKNLGKGLYIVNGKKVVVK